MIISKNELFILSLYYCINKKVLVYKFLYTWTYLLWNNECISPHNFDAKLHINFEWISKKYGNFQWQCL